MRWAAYLAGGPCRSAQPLREARRISLRGACTLGCLPPRRSRWRIHTARWVAYLRGAPVLVGLPNVTALCCPFSLASQPAVGPPSARSRETVRTAARRRVIPFYDARVSSSFPWEIRGGKRADPAPEEIDPSPRRRSCFPAFPPRLDLLPAGSRHESLSPVCLSAGWPVPVHLPVCRSASQSDSVCGLCLSHSGQQQKKKKSHWEPF